MQHMPDKEFDNLFRDKFKDAEIEPSANLWANIEKELEPKKKRRLPILWMAAASIAIAITTILVFQKKEMKYMQGDFQAGIETPVTTDNDTTAIKVQTAVIEKPMKATLAKHHPTTPKVNENISPSSINGGSENNLQNDKIAVQPNAPTDRLPIKLQDPKPIDILPIKEPIATEKPIVTAQIATIKGDLISDTETAERKGIRNVGDLVNYVVEKVDKREKKLIRFNTDDDDNSSIIGINIGFLKLNKKDK